MSWWSRRKLNHDIERELRAHLDLEAAEQRDGGATEDQAQYAARRSFGNVTTIVENTRAVWTRQWLEDLVADLRFAVRTFQRQPGATALIVLILALGTGANTAIFSVVHAVLLRPLPYRDADRVNDGLELRPAAWLQHRTGVAVGLRRLA